MAASYNTIEPAAFVSRLADLLSIDETLVEPWRCCYWAGGRDLAALGNDGILYGGEVDTTSVPHLSFGVL